MIERLEVVVGVGIALHHPDVRGIDRQQQVAVGLQMEGARIGRRRDEIDRARPARVAHVGDRKAVAEHVADKGMAPVHHDLHAVAAAALVGVADELDIARRNRDHVAVPLPSAKPNGSRDAPISATPAFSSMTSIVRCSRHAVGGAISSRARPRASGPTWVTAIAAIATMTAITTNTALRP